MLGAIALLVGSCASSEAKEGLGPVEPSPVVQVQVSPASVAVEVTQGVQFSAEARHEDGSASDASVTWSASGGSITSAGAYTAGSVPGSYRVAATSLDGRFADTSTVSISAAQLEAVILTPATTSLPAGGTRQFSVSGQWSDGSTTAPAVTYSATGGTISASGRYTAGATAGSYRVVATQQGGTLSDTSTVTINAAVLQAVILTPGSISLATGATQQFTVTGQWSDGATTPPTVTYSATGGTVTSGGLYTAGGAVGAYQVIATQSGGSLADTAPVIITTPGPGWLAHKPANYDNVVTNYGFDAPIPTATSDQPMGDGSLWNVYYPTSARTTTRIADTTGGVSPQFAVQTQYEIGDMGGVGKVKFYTNYLSGSVSEFYIALRVKWDANYEWNDISNKLFYVEPGNIVLQSRHNVGGIQRYLSVYVGAYDDDWLPDNNIPLPQGQWVTVEFLVKRSTTAGELRVWLNGVETMHKTNIRVPTTSSSQRLDINDTWGGGGGPRVRSSWRWLDHVYIATP